jgi:hypothetical protein
VTSCPRCGVRLRGADGYVDPRTALRRFTARPCGHPLDSGQAVSVRREGLPVEFPRLDGATLIAAERDRQPAEEGFSAEHDAQHGSGELAWAAWAYIDRAVGQHDPSDVEPPSMWPWSKAWWKPGRSPMRLLIIAGALIAAEIDRRLAEGEKP